MTIYFILIISFLIFEYILTFVIRILNLNVLDSKLPKEFEDIFDKESYFKTQEYTRVNSNYSYITSTFSLILS